MTLIVVGLGWVIGLLPVGAWGAPSWMGFAWIAAASPAILVTGPLRKRYVLVAAAAFAALLSGWLLTRASHATTPEWAHLVGSEVNLSGTIDSEPDRGLTVTAYVVRVEQVSGPDGLTLHGGKVLVQFNQYDRYLPGDRVRIEGELEPPGDGAPSGYREYLARRGINATIYRPAVREVIAGEPSVNRWLTGQRLEFDRSLQRSLPEPEASLAGGIAFGRDDGLSPEVAADFNRAGLRHLVAVSGSNVTLVAGLMYLLFIPLIGRRWAWIPAALAIASYLCAAGLAPSVIRSGLMALTFLFGAVIGRPQSGLPALAATVIAMTAVSPALATDPGFILSATATAGILAFYPTLLAVLRSVTSRRQWLAFPEWTLQAAALTTSATVATTPVTWAVFGRVSLISPIANVIVEPVFLLAFWASVLTSVVGRISVDAGVLCGDATFYPLTFIVTCARSFGSLPYASLDVPLQSTSMAALAYAVLAPAALLAYRFPLRASEEPRPVRQRRAFANRFVTGSAVGLTALAVVPITLLSHPGDGGLTVRFFDVGQGDAAFVTTPHGHQILIDGGPSGLGLVQALSGAMPHWDRSVDMVILSHPQEDHMAGLPELAGRYSVGALKDNGRDNTTRTYGYLRDAFAGADASLAAGDSFLVDGVRFEVLWPPRAYSDGELNDTSLVVRVSFGDVSFLFTGDSEAPVHRALIAAGVGHADVLKVPHHGSKTTDPALVQALSPTLAVISVGAGNIFGHPHPDTLEALSGVRVLRTDQAGTVTVRTDGQRLTVSTSR